MNYLKTILILLVSIMVLCILYIEFGGRFILDKADKRLFTWHVRTNKKLPENFTIFYNTVYPNSLSENSWNLIFNTVLNLSENRKECPCSQMAYRLFPILNIKNKTGIDYFLTSRYIEQNYTQIDCLNFNFNNFDFLEDRKGINQFSKSLFNKDIKDLKPIEMVEILALYENPIKNNRHKNLERTQTRAKYFYNLYLKNSK